MNYSAFTQDPLIKSILEGYNQSLQQSQAAAQNRTNAIWDERRKSMNDMLAAQGFSGTPHADKLTEFERNRGYELQDLAGQYGMAGANFQASLLPMLVSYWERKQARDAEKLRYNQAMGAGAAGSISGALSSPGFKGYSRADLVGEHAASFDPLMPEWYSGPQASAVETGAAPGRSSSVKYSNYYPSSGAGANAYGGGKSMASSGKWVL